MFKILAIGWFALPFAYLLLTAATHGVLTAATHGVADDLGAEKLADLFGNLFWALPELLLSHFWPVAIIYIVGFTALAAVTTALSYSERSGKK